MSTKKLSVIIGAIDKLSGPVKKISANIEKMRAPMDRVNRSVNTLKRNAGLREFNRGLKQSVRHAKAAGRAIRGMAKLAGSVAIIGGGSIAAFAKKYADAGDNIAKTSLRLGIGVEALQEYRFAAERSGVGAATFDMALQRFGRRAAEAANGTGEAKVALKDLGVQLKDSTGNMRSTEALLGDALSQLGRVKDPLTRNALAMKLFDSEGVKMVQMTAEGAEGIKKLREEFRSLSYAMSEDATKASEQFTDKSTNLWTVLSGLGNRIGEKLIPALNPLIDRLIELSLSVGPKVSEWAEGFAEKLPDRLEKLFDGLKRVWDVLKWLSDTFGLINIAVGAFAVIIGASLITAIATLASAFFALGAAIFATPIGWIILAVVAVAAAIAGLVYAVKYLGQFIGWLAFMVVSNWDVIVDSISSAVSSIVDVFKIIGAFNPFSLMLASVHALIKAFTGFDVLSSIADKLQSLLPDWALKLLGSDAQSSAPKSAAVMAPIPNQRAQVGGSLHVKIDSEGRPRVKDVRSDNPNVGVVVDAGMAMGGA